SRTSRISALPASPARDRLEIFSASAGGPGDPSPVFRSPLGTRAAHMAIRARQGCAQAPPHWQRRLQDNGHGRAIAGPRKRNACAKSDHGAHARLLRFIAPPRNLLPSAYEFEMTLSGSVESGHKYAYPARHSFSKYEGEC